MDISKNILNSSMIFQSSTPAPSSNGLNTPMSTCRDLCSFESFQNKKNILIQALEAKRKVSLEKS